MESSFKFTPEHIRFLEHIEKDDNFFCKHLTMDNQRMLSNTIRAIKEDGVKYYSDEAQRQYNAIKDKWIQYKQYENDINRIAKYYTTQL